VVAEDAFERRTEPGDRGAAPLVALVGGDRDPPDVPGLERVGQHEQLRLGVHGRALVLGADPRAADLDLVRVGAPAERAQVEEPRTSDEPSGRPQPVGERDDLVGVAVGDEPGEVGRHRGLAVRHERPLV
jgi:hypothetical protein